MRILISLVMVLLFVTTSTAALVPNITVLPNTTVEVGEEVYFDATDTTADDAGQLARARHEWDFDDGYYLRWDPNNNSITRSGIATTHYFMTPGTYTVTLTTSLFYNADGLGLPTAGLTAGGDSRKVGTIYFNYKIGETVTHVDATDTIPGDDVIPEDKWGIVALDIGTDTVIDVIEGPNNATGYDNASSAISGVPAVAENHIRLGYAAVVRTNGDFVFSENVLDSTNVTFASTNGANIYQGSNKAYVAWDEFEYEISGTSYTLAANSVGIAPGDDEVFWRHYGAVALDVGADEVVDIIKAPGNEEWVTYYDENNGATASLAALPEPETGHVRMGTVRVYASTNKFKMGVYPLETSTVSTYFKTVAFQEPVEKVTDTVEITVTGEAPMSGFEIQRAPFNNRTKQYLYIQIPEAHRANSTQLKVSLIGASTGTSILLEPKNNLSAEEVVLLDHTGLGIDDYVVQAELLNSEDTRISGGLWRDKFKKTYTGNPVVAMDENNSFIMNGEFVFPIGPYMANTTEFQDFIDKAGVNYTHTVGYNAVQNPESFDSNLASAATYGLVFTGPGRGAYSVASDYWSYSKVDRYHYNINPDIIEDYVELSKNRPVLFSWNWQDETNLGGRYARVYPPVVAAWSYRVHQEDPQHPTQNTFYGSDWTIYYGSNPMIDDYLGSADLFGGKKWCQDFFSFDIYPIALRLHPSLNLASMGPYAAYFDALDRMNTNNKGLIPITPTINPGNRLVGEKISLHSTEQVYFEAWANVIHGAKGIIWFQYFDIDTVKWTAMKKFSDQMNVLAPVVLQADSTTTVSDNSDLALNRVDTMVRDYDGSLYVFSARVTEPDPVTAQTYIDVGLPVGTLSLYTGVEPASIETTFTLSDSSVNGPVEVVDEDRTVTATNGVFVDTFSKNAVHIYRYPAQGASAAKATMGSGSSAVVFGNDELPAVVFGQ